MPYKDIEKNREAKRKYQRQHRIQIALSNKEWRKRNPEKVRKYQQTARQKLKMNKERREQDIRNKINAEKYEMFSHYSPDGSVRCMCPGCSENNLAFLQLHHIYNDGGAHRKLLRCNGGIAFYRKLRSQGYPHKENLQIMCGNCNGAIQHYGKCIHETEKSNDKYTYAITEWDW